ncbi:hypothetical protein A2U01_0026893, partial [Trifolium medium]|nr:hypothetical protein [Trifolium medium]
TTDEVGRQRGGWESKAHNSARRERVKLNMSLKMNVRLSLNFKLSTWTVNWK